MTKVYGITADGSLTAPWGDDDDVVKATDHVVTMRALDWAMATIVKEWTAEGADLLLPDEGELANTLRASLLRVTGS